MRLTTIKKMTSDPSLPLDRVERVVAADRVNDTAVYSRSGVALGTVDRLMIDRISGRIAYAVIAIGGGERRQALPWSVLHYDPLLGGYLVNLDRKVLEDAPTFARDESVDWNNEGWNRQLHDYYRVPHFWI